VYGQSRKDMLREAVGTLAEKYGISPMEVSVIILDQISRDEAVGLDYKDLDALVQEGLAERRQ